MSEALRHGPGICRVAASLAKRIPMGGGLGGGSSDGARSLLGLNQLWAGGLNRTALAALAAKLGSDMPFFCHDASSVCTGRGEVVLPTPRPAPRWVLLVLPDIHMPTPAVYKRFDQLGLGDSTAIEAQPDWIKWSQLPAEQLMAMLVNDLESPAFSIRPDLLECKKMMEELLGRRALMSGSGSSLFTLYDQQTEAEAAAKYMTAQMDRRGQKVRAIAVELAPAFADDLIAP